MQEERQKVLDALNRFPNVKHNYNVIVSGIGREAMAKAMMQLPYSDCTILLGFAAIVGEKEQLLKELQLGSPIEITSASLFGYEGQLFENGKPISTTSKTSLPQLFSLTSDKFVRTTDIAEKTIIDMEDYTFMYLKRPQDFIVRIISDFLPHEEEIDFFEEIKTIDFLPALAHIDKVL